MTTGLSLHIGLNEVDPARYEGWAGTLVACENDAHDMARLARAAGFEPTVLLTPDGTVSQVTAALGEAAARLGSGDILLFTYSGHGGQVPDDSGADDEPDALDETLVLYDRQFLDDEVQQAFRAFADDVRIVALLDCCHSGSSIEIPGGTDDGSGRYLPEPQQRQLYERDRGFFDELRRSLAEDGSADGAPDALLVSACQDNQVASDGPVNGAFTEALLRVWDDGAFQGGYRDFHRSIQRGLPPTQSPNLYLTGSPDPEFLAQRPFTV
ncbi:caspase family protein [Streptomyces sp. NBC_00094]|uniref:caspase family protein n=1 Tax=Streptomyces sp. NBC_00094 TaxID=2903620 RepID=UPI00224F93D2|nr:caspase family protein [Streptomyces sp. NBC_00094]MCX5394377.1 caspase family protein [Streptomyces sp. NBC_00094]